MLEHLQEVTIFAGLEERALDLLLQRAERECYDPEAVIVREGEPGNRFFLIINGTVAVLKRSPDGNEVELARLGRGDFFGEVCILDTFPRTATIRTLERTDLLRVPALAFLDLYETDAKQYGLLVLNMARDLARRLRRLDEVFAARQ